jgi:hypothetical protein
VFANYWPNSHTLVQRFPLLDNFYAPSRQSADGHPWIVSAIAAYTAEIESPDWVRSYPGGNSNDAMVYTPKGFLWQAAEQQGLKAKLYGEWSGYFTINGNPPYANPFSWSQWYPFSQCLEVNDLDPSKCTNFPMTETSNVEISTVPSVTKILDPHYPEFNLNIPDQYRVDYWLPIFHHQLAHNDVPALSILWVICDHTTGYSTGYPYPQAQQADNDLAVGRIVEAISHSSIWGNSAIFIEEDDAQNGVDHVDGHRSPALIVSPWTVQNNPRADHTTYTALNMDRTIEQILGMQPMTQFDLVASPMRTAFTTATSLTPSELAPFKHLPPTIPLNTLVTSTSDADTIEGAWRLASDRLFEGKVGKADAVEPDVLNHVIWYAATEFKKPYPGETKVRWPSEFDLTAAGDGDDD